MQDEQQVNAYYKAALLALRGLEKEKPTGRRFGPDADARWNAFRGDMTASERLDLLIRDADAQWPGAFGARTVFAAGAVAEDDAFGAQWTPLEPVDAEELWRVMLKRPAPTGLRAALEGAARVWDVELKPAKPGRIAAADKLLVVGPSMLVAVAEAFEGASALDFTDQVVVIATPPAHRQLAALASAFLGATKPLSLLSAPAEARGKTPASLRQRRLLQSSDAADTDLDYARAVAGGGSK